MEAIVYDGVGKVKVTRVPLPEIEDERDVVLKVTASGLCGSDLHMYHGRLPIKESTVMGHEVVGVVHKVGSAVKKFKVGERVGCAFATACGDCFYCHNGVSSRCSGGGAQTYGVVNPVTGVGLQGGQTHFLRVPFADGTLLHLPATISDDLALLLADILPTGYYCCKNAGVGPETRVVALVGCGPVGMMALVAAKILGAKTVIAFDYVEDRVEMAKRFGATQAYNLSDSTNDAVSIISSLSSSRGADAVLEVVGNDPALELAYKLVRPAGVLSSIGAHTSEKGVITAAMGYAKNLTFRIGRCPARSLYEELLPLASSGVFDGVVEKLVSHRMPLSEGVRAYEMFDKKVEGCTKVVFVNE